MARRWSVLSVLPFAAALPAQVPGVEARAKDPFAVVRQARAGGYRMLLRQFRAEEPQLGDRHEAGARPAMPAYGAERDLPAAHWVWVRPSWFLFRDGPGEDLARTSWGPEHACGAPDTPEAGDHGTAWATREEDAAGEWLLLEYGAPVRATRLEVHETFHPGALARVTIFHGDGEELEVWKAPQTGPADEPKRALVVDLPLGFTVERVRLHLHSEAVPGWNEIDAVGLHDDRGRVHWAACAEASSTFANAEQRVRLVRAVVAVRPAVVEIDVASAVRRAEVPLQVEVTRRALPGDAAPAARVAALAARIAALEAELARLRAELAKLQAEAGK